MTAAREHFAYLSDLPLLPTHYPLAYYTAGLTVECIFRAYNELIGNQHDAHHDLRLLAEGSRFLSFLPLSVQDDVEVQLSEIQKRWLNNHRYKSFSSIRRFLTDAELYKAHKKATVKGDIVKYNWDILLNAALTIASIGINQWANSKTMWRP